MPLLHLPERRKVWTRVRGNTVQQPESTGALHAQQAFVTAHGLFLGSPAPGFTCSGTSDSVTAGLDGVNRLVTKANVVAAAGAHSWSVVKNTINGCQYCFDFNSATGPWLMTFVWSPGGLFTGGSTTARPTATDETVVRSAANWFIGNNTNKVNISIWHSEDGQNTHLVFVTATNIQAYWSFGRIFDPKAWVTQPYYANMMSTGSATSTLFADQARLCVPSSNAEAWSIRGPSGSGIWARATAAWSATQFLWQRGAVLNTLTQMYECEEHGLYNHANPDYGRYGTLPDLLSCNGPSLSAFCTDPNNPDLVAISLGFWLLPWPNNSYWQAP